MQCTRFRTGKVVLAVGYWRVSCSVTNCSALSTKYSTFAWLRLSLLCVFFGLVLTYPSPFQINRSFCHLILSGVRSGLSRRKEKQCRLSYHSLLGCSWDDHSQRKAEYQNNYSASRPTPTSGGCVRLHHGDGTNYPYSTKFSPHL